MPNILGQTSSAGGATTGTKAAFGLGSAMEVGSDILSGIDAAKIGSRISGQYTRQAQAIKLASGNEIGSEDYQANQLLAKSRTSAASGGVTQGGSTKVVNDASYTEQNLKDAFTRYSGEMAANQALYEAANARWQGKIQQQSSFVKAGTTALTSGMMLAGGL